MYFYLTGIDYKSAPIHIRDEIYRYRKLISDFWFKAASGNAVVLATCNRIEIYGVASSLSEVSGCLRNFFDCFVHFSKYAYVRYGREAVLRHALRLAVGLESQIRGERQISMQLIAWLKDSCLPESLNGLWNEAFLFSKQIRATSGLNAGSGDIATLVLGDIEGRLKKKDAYEIAVIGTGKIASLFARASLSRAHLSFVANKNFKGACDLAQYSNGKALRLKDVPGLLKKADVLICATSSPHYVLNQNHFSGVLKDRKVPLYAYDLAVPRDIDPEVKRLEGILLQNLDDLSFVFSEYNALLCVQAEAAQVLIDDALRVYQEVAFDA